MKHETWHSATIFRETISTFCYDNKIVREKENFEFPKG